MSRNPRNLIANHMQRFPPRHSRPGPPAACPWPQGPPPPPPPPRRASTAAGLLEPRNLLRWTSTIRAGAVHERPTSSGHRQKSTSEVRTEPEKTQTHDQLSVPQTIIRSDFPPHRLGTITATVHERPSVVTMELDPKTAERSCNNSRSCTT